MEEFEKVDSGAGIYTNHDGVNLESLYSQCNAELTLQQSKRDQIIGVYLSVAGFIIPSILGLNLGMLPMAAAFLLMYVIGDVLCKVVVRYRIYKEVYWITSRTIAALFRVEGQNINKDLVQKLFADNIRRGCASVVIVKPEWKKRVGIPALTAPIRFDIAVDHRATAKKISNSAETLLYKLMALMSAATMFLAIFCGVLAALPQLFTFGDTVLPILIAIAVAAVGGLLIYRKEKNYYIQNLTAVYAYCFDGSKDSYNTVYAKAWFLHGYND